MRIARNSYALNVFAFLSMPVIVVLLQYFIMNIMRKNIKIKMKIKQLLFKICMLALMLSIVLPLQALADGYSPEIINDTGWFNQEQINPNRSRGVALYFFILVVIVLLIFYGEHMKIGLIMIFAALMCFFFAYLVYTTISSIIGGILVIIALFVFFRGIAVALE